IGLRLRFVVNWQPRCFSAFLVGWLCALSPGYGATICARQSLLVEASRSRWSQHALSAWLCLRFCIGLSSTPKLPRARSLLCWQRRSGLYAAARRADRERNARLRDRLAYARAARTRQYESATDFIRANCRIDHAITLRRFLHRHVPVSCHPVRCTRKIEYVRGNLRLEFGDADEGCPW